VREKIFARFRRILPKWEASIRQSFLHKKVQDQYIAMVRYRAHILDVYRKGEFDGVGSFYVILD